jgi:hypothetical protein
MKILKKYKKYFMAFKNKIKQLSTINEVISEEEFGNINQIINDRKKVISLLSNETAISYQDNSKNKIVDIAKINDKEYINLLKNKYFKKSLRIHFKKKSQYRKEVLKTFSGKKWLKDRFVITNLFKRLNSPINKFSRSIVYELNGKVDKQINDLTSDSDFAKEIENLLENNGFSFVIFEIGSCYKGKTLFSIKDALDEIKNKNLSNPDMIKKIGEYLQKINLIYDNNYKIVFTLESRKVASQSTGVNWRSCMNLVNGENKHFVGSSIAAGIAVAYLTRVGDHLKINKPLGRVLIKPMVNKDNIKSFKNEDIYYHVENLYTSDKFLNQKNITDVFVKKVKEIIDNVNKFISKDIIEKKSEQPTKSFILQREKEDYYKDSIDQIVIDVRLTEIIEKANLGEEVDEEKLKEVLEENKKNKKEIDKNLVISLLKNKKYDYLFDKYEIPIAIDSFLIKRIPNVKKIKEIKLDSLKKSLTVDSENKNEKIEILNIKYEPIRGRANNLSEVSSNIEKLTFKKFEYDFNSDIEGKFKIDKNLNNFKTPLKEKIMIEKDNYIFNNLNDYDSIMSFSPKNYDVTNAEKKEIKERFKIKINENFNKNITYGLLSCEIEFPRKINNDKESFNVILDSNSVITKFPEKYYLNYSNINSFEYFSSKKSNQAGFLYKNLFNVIINFQKEYLLKYFDKKNQESISKIDEILFSKHFKIEKMPFLVEFKNDSNAFNDLYSKIRKIIPTSIFFSYYVNIENKNFINYFSQKNSILEESVKIENKNIEKINEEDFFTYIFKIKNICTIFKANFVIIDMTDVNPSIKDFENSLKTFKYTEYSDKKDFMNDESYHDFIYIKKAEEDIVINRDFRVMMMNDKTELSKKDISLKFKKQCKIFYIKNLNLNSITIEGDIEKLDISNSNIKYIYFKNFKYENVEINNSNIEKIESDQEKLKYSSLSLINCKTMPKNLNFAKIEIFNSDLDFNGTILNKLFTRNVDLSNIKNINFKKSIELYGQISIDGFDFRNFPIFFEDSENNEKIKKMLKNDKDIIFIKEAKSILINYDISTYIYEKIMSLLDFNKRLNDPYFIDEILFMGDLVSREVYNRIFYSETINNLRKAKEEFRKKIVKKKEEKIQDIEQKKPIGSFLKRVKKRIMGDSFVSTIKNIDSENYFD